MKIISEVHNSVPVVQLVDGQLAVIVKWGGVKHYEGLIVQRYGDDLINLGKDCGASWDGFFRCNTEAEAEYQVRILGTGTTLQV